MRVFIRERRTGLYYAGAEQWTYDIKEAKDFGRGESAGRMANRVFRPVELVYSFDNYAIAFTTPWGSQTLISFASDK